MEKRYFLFLIILFMGVLGARLYFAFTSEHLTPEAYFHVRQIEHVRENWLPLVDDELSYGGRKILTSPLFYYIIALFTFFMPESFAYDFIPQLFISTLPVIAFFLVKKITKRNDSAFFSAVLAGFSPIIFTKTLHTLSPVNLLLPLFFLNLFLFLYVDKKKYVIHFVALILIISLIHSSSTFMVASLLGYLLLCRLESLKLVKAEIELILFSSFIYIWSQFIIYKEALIFHGISILRQGFTNSITSNYLSYADLSNAMILLGIYPLFFGIYCIYTYLFVIKKKEIYMYIPIIFFAALLAFMRFVEPVTGLLYVGISLSILSGPGYVQFRKYFRKTRFSFFSRHLFLLLWVALVPSLIIPSFYLASFEKENIVSSEVYDSMLWMNQNFDDRRVVLAAPLEGHLITAVASQQNVADTYTLLITDLEERLGDIKKMYTTKFATDAARLFDKYDIDYILVSDTVRKLYGINDLSYSDEDCINKVYNNKEVVLYHTLCRIQVN